MNSLKKKGAMHRRAFFLKAGTASLAGLGLILGLTACGSGGADEKATGTMARQADSGADHPCGDPSTFSKAARTTRKTFEYQEKSPDPAKACRKCNFWQEPTGDGPCGGCTLVKGPINPKGTCRSWVEKGTAGT